MPGAAAVTQNMNGSGSGDTIEWVEGRMEPAFAHPSAWIGTSCRISCSPGVAHAVRTGTDTLYQDSSVAVIGLHGPRFPNDLQREEFVGTYCWGWW